MDDVIKCFYGKLVSELPMEDANFRALLLSADLFPGDLKQSVCAKLTPAEKAEYFINHGINNDDEKFAKLVDVMAESGSSSLVRLAAQIRRNPHYSKTTGLDIFPNYICDQI